MNNLAVISQSPIGASGGRLSLHPVKVKTSGDFGLLFKLFKGMKNYSQVLTFQVSDASLPRGISHIELEIVFDPSVNSKAASVIITSSHDHGFLRELHNRFYAGENELLAASGEMVQYAPFKHPRFDINHHSSGMAQFRAIIPDFTTAIEFEKFFTRAIINWIERFAALSNEVAESLRIEQDRGPSGPEIVIMLPQEITPELF
jgi:hypothetical protein